MNKNAFAPGCFGSALTWRENDEVCKSCPYTRDCEARSRVALEQLRELCGVQVAPQRRANGALSKRAEAVLDKLDMTTAEIRGAIQAGRNPFPKQSGFLREICAALMIQPANRAFLTMILQRRMEITETVADVYTRLALQILNHCEAITTEGDAVSLLKESKD